tara:strand:- start:2093 stop:3532 length:1440 start_codon:yes stop_codon:yes gene_type:complete
MKIAILTYGEYRTAKDAVRTWNILNTEHLIDVYVHTQNKSDDSDISEEDIKNLFPNPKIWLEGTRDYLNDESPRDIHLNFRSYRFLYQKLLENETDDYYDFIIVNRLDSSLYIDDIDTFLENYDKTAIYTLDESITYENPFIQDHFFMGSGTVISNFLKNLPPVELMKSSHTDFGKYLLSTKLKNKQTNIHCFHVRPNQIDFLKKTDFKKSFNPDFHNTISELESKHISFVKSINILVIGESCEDIFIYGKAERLSPEAPVPVLVPSSTTSNKGMAENVQLNLKSLGISPKFITNSENIKKIRYVDESYNYILLRVDENDKVDKLSEIPDSSKYDITVIVDYNKGFLSESDILKLSSNCNLTFLDTKKKLGDWCRNITFIKINYNEYLNSKEFIDNNEWINEKLIVTRGPYGCDYNEKNYPTKEVGVKDVAGAGDSFLAGLIFKYIQTKSIENSIQFANRCSTQVVQKKGVSIVNKNML